MHASYTVYDGDCIYSISAELGFLADTLWNFSENAALKSKRKDPFLLLPGDVVKIPDKRLKFLPKRSAEKHRFRRKNSAIKLRLKLVVDGKPRANLSYSLETDVRSIKGITNSEGLLEVQLSPLSTSARLIVDDGQEEFTLAIGSLDPVDEPTGIQARLMNLGYYQGRLENIINEETTLALTAFQEEQSIKISGKPDSPTLDKLVKLHGC
jgi:hypothetical protein